jgi:hypothetical protein
MLWQTVARDDVAVPMHDTPQARELGEATAWVICMEAGERAREGALDPSDRPQYELQLRCALAGTPNLIKTYVGYLDLAILAGEILLKYTRKTEGCDEMPPCSGLHS